MAVLAAFMVLTAAALERTVSKSRLEAEEDALKLLVYNLLAAVDRDETGLSIGVSIGRGYLLKSVAYT